MGTPTPVPAKPAIVKEIPNSLFPKLQAVTKTPINVSIAPRAQVSMGVPISIFGYCTFKAFAILPQMISCSTQMHYK